MLYIVEVALDPGGLVEEMGQMRTWLDHMSSEPIALRQSATSCRFDFMDAQQASAFAQAFSGRMLGPSAP
jgi:hypothetical protein